MDLEALFELIRKEPVCLFIGSGFSLYAGIPSANKLISLLTNILTPSQIARINTQQDLRRFTEDYAALFGRKKLIEVLQQHIDVSVSDTHLHDLLAKIPLFKSIITTNYDRLIEDSMGANASVAVNNSNIFNAKRARTRIFKIHGDIRDGDSIVISSSDYAKQYNRMFKDPFWASVIAEISSQHIIFLGYGYEDENVWADFDYVEQKLKNKNKKRVFISPSINETKKKRLKKSNISYVQTDGEMFVNGLIACLKLNLVDDHRNGFIDTQTAQEFITAFDLKVNIQASKGSAQVVEISRADGPTKHTFKFTTSDQELIKSYQQFSRDYAVRDLKISSDQLDSFAMVVEDFTFLKKDSLAHIKVSHTPKYDGRCKIKFLESGFSLSKVHCRLFNSIPGKALIEIEAAGFNAVFNLEHTENHVQMNFKITEPKSPSPINKAYEVLKAFYLFFLGEPIEIYPKGSKSVKFRLSKKAHVDEFRSKMNFFYALKQIEKTFEVKFPPIVLADITEDEKNKVQKLHNLMEHGYHAVREDDGLMLFQMPRSKQLFDALKSKDLSKGYVSIETQNGRDIELYGKVLHLGDEQVSVKQPTVANLNFEELSMKLIPVDNLVIYHYKKFGHWEMPNAKNLWRGKEHQ